MCIANKVQKFCDKLVEYYAKMSVLIQKLNTPCKSGKGQGLREGGFLNPRGNLSNTRTNWSWIGLLFNTAEALGLKGGCHYFMSRTNTVLLTNYTITYCLRKIWWCCDHSWNLVVVLLSLLLSGPFSSSRERQGAAHDSLLCGKKSSLAHQRCASCECRDQLSKSHSQGENRLSCCSFGLSLVTVKS